MIARRLMVLFVLAGALNAPVRAQERCGVGKDLIVQTLERVHPGSNASTMQDGVELLKHAISTCPTLGDAWYYRSLLEQRLGNTRLANYALTKAQDNNSEAYRQKLDPFTLSTKPNAPPVGPVRDKWALVVGISQFQDKALHPLNYTTNDADTFAAALTNPNVGRFKASNVVKLENSQATTRNIKEKLNWLARSAGPDDLVVIYIASHGSPRGADTAGVSYIITNDTEVSPKRNAAKDSTADKDDRVDHDALFATALPMVEVANTVASRVSAQRVAIFLDTCFSGSAAGSGGTRLIATGLNSATISKDTLDRMSQGTGRIILAASQDNQESLESSSLKHGFFTYYLIEELIQSKGMDPMGKVYQYVRDKVTARAKQQQVPAMSQSEQGDQIVLGAPLGANVASNGGG